MQQGDKMVVERKMGEQERYLHNLHRFGGLIAVTVLEIEGPLSPELVKRGLDWLQKKHPMLQAHVKFSGFGRTKEFPWIFRQPHFSTKGTLSIPLRVVDLTDEQSLKDLVQIELKTPIKFDNSPRKRAVLVQNWRGTNCHKLVLTTDHTIGDAQASCRSIHDLMKFFQNPSAHERDLPQHGLPPSLESRMPKKPESGSKPYQPAIRIPAKPSSPGQRQSITICHVLTKDQTAAIKEKLSEKRTTMNGLLAANMLKNLSEEYGLDEMTCLCNVELRRMCTPQISEESYGCYIDILRTKHDVTLPVWDLARDVTFRLISTLVHDQASASLLKMPTGEVYRAEAMPMMKTGMRLDALAVTTAGESNLNFAYGEFRLADVTMNMSLHMMGASMFLISFEREGALNINLCYTHPNLSSQQANKLLNQTVVRMLELTMDEEMDS